MLAIVETMKRFKYLLDSSGFEVVVFTDHRNLLHFRAMPITSRKHWRWANILETLQFSIRFIPGAKNCIADFLSQCVGDGPDVAVGRKLFDSTTFRVGAVGNLAGIQAFWEEALSQAHDRAEVAHPGVKGTVWNLLHARVKGRFLHKIASYYVATCPECQKYKNNCLKPEGWSPLYRLPEEPFDDVHVDILGPLPVSEGMRFVTLFVDRFTRYSMGFATATVPSAERLWHMLRNGWCWEFPLPGHMTSDQGPQFTSFQCGEVLRRAGVHRHLTTAYR
ncbi:MAG: DDE-type integrase/transposase/recombinase, partial [Eubacterium aggregans]